MRRERSPDGAHGFLSGQVGEWVSFNEMEIPGEEQVGDSGRWRSDKDTKAIHYQVVSHVPFPADCVGSTTQKMLNEPWQFLHVDMEDWRPAFHKQNTVALAIRPPSTS